jgi:hypothetical protein
VAAIASFDGNSRLRMVIIEDPSTIVEMADATHGIAPILAAK